MAEDEEKNWLRIIIPRVAKAALYSALLGAVLLVPLNLLLQMGIERYIPYGWPELSLIVIVFVVFEFAIRILTGTILHYALSIARTIISMTLCVVLTGGGIVTTQFEAVEITIDFSSFLAALLALSLLNVAKNMLHALDFLSERTEQPVTLQEFP